MVYISSAMYINSKNKEYLYETSKQHKVTESMEINMHVNDI